MSTAVLEDRSPRGNWCARVVAGENINALTTQLISVVKDQKVEDVLAAFFELCVHLDVEMHKMSPCEFSIAHAASLERRGQSYKIGCGLLNATMRQVVKG